MRVCSLFAGIGGMDLGFEQAGFGIDYANDFDKYCKQTYYANFNVKMQLADINEVDVDSIPDFDILVGGFPCQPFSIAGKRQGFEDKRGNLFFKICEIIEQKKPEVVVLENVKGLVNHDRGNTFAVILDELHKLKYKVYHKILNTADYGIPQNRQRVYIVCFKERSINFEYPEQEQAGALSDCIDFTRGKDNKYYYIDSQYLEMLKEKCTDKDYCYSLRRGQYVRQSKKQQCPTLTTTMGTGGHNVPIILADLLETNVDNKYLLSDRMVNCVMSDRRGNRFNNNVLDRQIACTINTSASRRADMSNYVTQERGLRRLTPRECARLQGFPDSFIIPVSDTQAYKQFGNAVSVNVSYRVALQIKKAFETAKNQ